MGFIMVKKNIYVGLNLKVYMDKRVISGLDLRGQSENHSVRLLKYSVER